jgi:hypothetical protein
MCETKFIDKTARFWPSNGVGFRASIDFDTDQSRSTHRTTETLASFEHRDSVSIKG